MAIHPGARADSRPESPIERLVRERGLRQFGLFFVTGEGDFFPNGDEEQSGYVIDNRGQIYSFWTGWDPAHRDVVFTEWEKVEEEPEWRDVGEYHRARARAGAPRTFEELVERSGWLTIPEMVELLDADGYWLRHPTVLSRRAKQRHVADLIETLVGPHRMPLLIRAVRSKTNEVEYIHPLSASSDDIRHEGQYRLAESLKCCPNIVRSAEADQPIMTLTSDGRLVIRAERDADPASVERSWHVLEHLQSPDDETREENEARGLLSARLRQLIESGRINFMEGVARQEQQSMRAYLRRMDGMRLLAQLMAALDYLGQLSENDNVLACAYEAGLFAS
jgi:hypothetical protein